ncbi:MAG: tetratricopeptide repeat protein [Dehalococcoidia bacterium]
MELPDFGYITKTLAPRRRRDLVERPRLLALLKNSSDLEVTAVVAPPGYGKTTLLLQYVAPCTLPHCWLTLDDFDRESTRFLHYLILALDQVVTGLADELLPLLSADEDHPHVLRECLARLVTRVHLNARSHFLLVLDDVHILDGSAAAQDILEPFLQYLPQACHVLLSGRKLPDLGALHRLRAQRQLESYGTPDLSFTSEEALALVASVSAGRIADADAEAILDRCEGWAAGLAIMAQGSGRTNVRDCNGLSALFGYLCADAYERLPEERRELLLTASGPRTINAELLHNLLPEAGENELERLEEAELFIQRIDGPRVGFRFHQLYRDFLQQRLQRTDPKRYHSVHLQVAMLLAKAGEWQEALDHCAEVQEWEQAASILERVTQQASHAGQWQALIAAIERLPENVLAGRHGLALVHIQACTKIGEIARASAALDALMPSLEREGSSVAHARGLLLHGVILRCSGRLPEAVERLAAAVTMFQQQDASVGSIAEARRQLGICAGMAGDFTRAESVLAESLTVFESMGDGATIAAIHDSLGICYKRLGRFGDALVQYQRASDQWRELGNLTGLVNSLNNAGTLYHEQGDQERAQQLFVEQLSTSRVAGDPRGEAYALIGLGDVALSTEAIDVAHERFACAFDRCVSLGESFTLTYARCGLAESKRRRGALEQAEDLLREALIELRQQADRLERGLCLFYLGLVERDRREPATAVLWLNEAIGLFAGRHALHEEARACFILASVQFEGRHRRQAAELLERVAEIVEEIGSEQCIIREASEAPLLIQYAAAQRLGDGLYGRLVHRLLQTGIEVPSSKSVREYPPLSVRTLGAIEICVGKRMVTDLEWRSSASRELFLYLLTEGEGRRREEIAAAIWPYVEVDRQRSFFHSNLHRLRQALYSECIVHQNGRYAVNREVSFEYDVFDFRRHLEEAETYPRGSEQRAASLRDALRIYRGPFAEEFFSEWSAMVRIPLEDGYLRATASLAGFHAGRGEYQESIELCERILTIDRYHEGATLELMRSQAALGNVGEALRTYRQFFEFLRDEGVGAPGAPLTRLYRRLSDELDKAI